MLLADILGWPLASARLFRVYDLLAQVPAIHRSFMHITRSDQRIFSIRKAQLLCDPGTGDYWVQIEVIGLPGGSASLLESRRAFRSVFELAEVASDRRTFQTASTVAASAHEALRVLAPQCQRAGMLALLTNEGYRFYVGDFEPKVRLHQILASYFATFYFGSVARYRPAEMEKALNGQYGWAIEEFLATQERQLVYLLANEILGRELVRPWSVSPDRFRL